MSDDEPRDGTEDQPPPPHAPAAEPDGGEDAHAADGDEAIENAEGHS